MSRNTCVLKAYWYNNTRVQRLTLSQYGMLLATLCLHAGMFAAIAAVLHLQSAWLTVEVLNCCCCCLCPAGKGGERGVARPEVLQALLGSCERVVQEIDSVEYGLTDIQVGGNGRLRCTSVVWQQHSVCVPCVVLRLWMRVISLHTYVQVKKHIHLDNGRCWKQYSTA